MKYQEQFYVNSKGERVPLQLVLNSDREQILLNPLEQRVADYLQKIVNELPLGFDVAMTTLTTIVKKVSEQKFFEILPADYMPMRAGEGAWSDQLLTYRSFQLGGGFEDGIIASGADSSRLASTDAGVDSKAIVVRNWAKTIGWSLFDLQQAMKSGNWDIVAAKEEARKKNWDLGIQDVAFLGTRDRVSKGFLTQATSGTEPVTLNTSLITKPISTMSSTELSTFLVGLYEAYRLNCARTAKPSLFTVPEDDFNGLTVPSTSDFPIKSKLMLIEETMTAITGAPFKVKPCAYGMTANSKGLLSHPRYVLSNFDDKSIRMDVPVPYTSTLANTINGFQFQNVGYGQFTGLGVYRNLEIMYFDNNNG